MDIRVSLPSYGPGTGGPRSWLRRTDGGCLRFDAACDHVRARARRGRSGRAAASADRLGPGSPRSSPAAASRPPATPWRGSDRAVRGPQDPAGARGEDGEQTQLVAVFDHAEHPALSQVEVVGGDELAAFAPVLETAPELRVLRPRPLAGWGADRRRPARTRLACGRGRRCAIDGCCASRPIPGWRARCWGGCRRCAGTDRRTR